MFIWCENIAHDLRTVSSTMYKNVRNSVSSLAAVSDPLVCFKGCLYMCELGSGLRFHTEALECRHPSFTLTLHRVIVTLQ
jgi:hypothetical protein